MMHIIVNALWVGALAGILGELVRLGWSQTMPIHSQGLNQQSPAKRLLEQLGLTKAERSSAVKVPGGQRIEYLPLALHYIYAILLAVFFVVWANVDGRVTEGLGTLYGFGCWAVFDVILLPLLKTVPMVWRRPWPELLVELIGYLLFGWTLYLVAIGLPISGVYF
ncbi:hypothetical protein FPFC_050490 [Fructobacillus pseudoficulneus]|uniref:Integral membrane protein n=1 Tax=Fructobacillus pseudoficulneus TaxID=220714 RepID=A0A3F3GZ53_9LACO|nr:DUF1440 domain-containing protein [Fructobacillus pseudoficulneus]GAP03232.1 hypothetical protein FPFC_050490 [Fructobacillus pseudoficulneus]SEH42891.1 putative membrane protein [Fructobacillus pseudoficulneus]